jgi:hypothetical protein
MTNAGDMIVGGVAGAPARLAAGSAGYIQRIVAGTPVWRELSSAGLVGVRPNPVATREGQWYWSTNAAAGQELAVCTHQGGSTYAWVTVPYGVTSTGVALVQAADAAAARTAIAITAGSLASRAASPAVGARHYATDFDVDLACRTAGTWGVPGVGPLAVTRGPFTDTGAKMLTAAGVAVGPIGGPGTTLAMGLHVASLPGASEVILAEYWSASGGWILGVSAGGGTANRLYLLHVGMDSAAKTELGDLATGSYAIAISIAPTALRWSIKGAAIGSAVISGTYTPPASDSVFVIGGHVSGGLAPTGVSVAWLASWGATLSDAVLQAITTTHATYLPGEAGATPVAAYLAGRTRRDALAAEAVGSQVALLTVPSTLGWTAR